MPNETNSHSIDLETLKSFTDERLQQIVRPCREIDFAACESSLRQFVESSFEVLDPGVEFSNNWHLGYVCEHLEMVTEGEIKLLVINIPPAHMKSLMATVCWPVWTWMKWPESRWIFSSYSSELSTTHSLLRRRLIKSDWFQSQWADKFQLVGDQDRKTIFENNSKGYFMSTSTGGTTGGKHGDFLVIDDPINPELALSDLKRNDGNTHVKYMIKTRKRDPATSRAVLIMQRLHEDDPVAQIEKMVQKLGVSEKYKAICIPAVMPTKTIITFPKSGDIIEREENDILWPERFPRTELESIKETLGSFVYSAQYQQTPAPIEGGLVKYDWFKFFREPPGNILRCGWFWDTAIRDKKTSDWSVGVLMAKCENGYYILDIIRKKLLYPQLKTELETAFRGSNAHFAMVEDKSSGHQIVDELAKDVDFAILPFTPIGDKTQRLSLVSSLIEAGKLFLPLEHPKTRIFIDEFCFFPHGTHDDCVDAGVMGLSYFHLKKKIGKFRDSEQGLQQPPMAGRLGDRQYGSD